MPFERRMPNVIQTAILNLSLRDLANWLADLDMIEFRRWIADNVTITSLLPLGWEQHIRLGKVKRHIAITALQTMDDASWDYLLGMLDAFAVQAKATGDPVQIASANRLWDKLAIIVGDNRAKQWYHTTMDRFRDEVLSALQQAKGGKAAPADALVSAE